MSMCWSHKQQNGINLIFDYHRKCIWVAIVTCVPMNGNLGLLSLKRKYSFPIISLVKTLEHTNIRHTLEAHCSLYNLVVCPAIHCKTVCLFSN